MTEFEHKVIEYIIEAKERMTRIETDLREHKEGVIQNRTRIVFLEELIEKLEEKEESMEDEIKGLKAPSDTKVTLNTLKKWGAWIITMAAAAKIMYDIFN